MSGRTCRRKRCVKETVKRTTGPKSWTLAASNTVRCLQVFSNQRRDVWRGKSRCYLEVGACKRNRMRGFVYISDFTTTFHKDIHN